MPHAYDTPKCPTCGELMMAPEGAFLCPTALAESYQDADGTWRREEGSAHPVLDTEVSYLEQHGFFPQFI